MAVGPHISSEPSPSLCPMQESKVLCLTTYHHMSHNLYHSTYKVDILATISVSANLSWPFLYFEIN